MRLALILILVSHLTSLAVGAEPPPATEEASPETQGVMDRVLLYLPNRVFDLMDVVRVRVRFGPGIAASLRATRPASISVASYEATYVGLPGPRRRPEMPHLVGPESLSGFRLSVVNRTAPTENDPGYGPAEVGAGAHFGLVGLDLGVDLLEMLDLVTGFFLIDLTGDDL